MIKEAEGLTPRAATTEAAQLAAVGENWNIVLTKLIRQSHSTYWGNWSLNANVDVGAVGAIDPESGTFTRIAMLPSITPSRAPFTQHWKMSSQNVSKTSTSVALDGSYTDPTTGTKVTVGTEVTWSFGSSGDVSSSFLVTSQQNLENPGNQIESQLDWLVKTATENQYATGGHITQGFGVVTSVLWAESGLNIGATSDNSTFSLTGSVAGMTGMADSADAKASLKGSYFSEKSSATFDSHIWPAAPGELAATNAPVAFTFASFTGDNLLIPIWLNMLQEFRIITNNANGGTYIVNCTLTYDVPGQDKPVSQSHQVSGGMSKQFDGVPLNATNLKLVLGFEAGPTLHQSWATPLSLIPTGTCRIDIYGVWANAPHITVSNVPEPL